MSLPCLKPTPLLNGWLNRNTFKNYRPVPISKLIEKAVDKQVNDHISRENIKKNNQLAYGTFQSTKIVLSKIYNDISTTSNTGIELMETCSSG